MVLFGGRPWLGGVRFFIVKSAFLNFVALRAHNTTKKPRNFCKLQGF